MKKFSVSNLDDSFWYDDNSGDGPRPVGQKKPMVLGCMICLVTFGSGFGTGTETIRLKINQSTGAPTAPPGAGAVVGATLGEVRRVSSRSFDDPTSRDSYLGSA